MSYGLQVFNSAGAKTIEFDSHIVSLVGVVSSTQAAYYGYIDYPFPGFDPAIPGHFAILVEGSVEDFYLSLHVGFVRCHINASGDYGIGTLLTVKFMVFK